LNTSSTRPSKGATVLSTSERISRSSSSEVTAGWGRGVSVTAGLSSDAHPNAPGRWNHYLRTFEAGQLLDEPIPQVQFAATPDSVALKGLSRCVDLLAYRDSHWTAFENFIQWLAWGLAVSKDRPQIEEATSEALYRTFTFEHLLLHPHDYLGQMLCDRRGKGWNPHAYYPTPHALCECMTQIAFSSGIREKGKRREKVFDPCMASGRMLLHASNHSLRLFGVDIDGQVVRAIMWNLESTIGEGNVVR